MFFFFIFLDLFSFYSSIYYSSNYSFYSSIYSSSGFYYSKPKLNKNFLNLIFFLSVFVLSGKSTQFGSYFLTSLDFSSDVNLLLLILVNLCFFEFFYDYSLTSVYSIYFSFDYSDSIIFDFLGIDLKSDSESDLGFGFFF